MDSNEQLPFLQNLDADYSQSMRKAWWLISDFDEPVWTINAGYSLDRTIDWRISLNNNTMLTAPENANLLASLKYWMISSTEGTYGKFSKNAAARTDRQRLQNTIYNIDFLLLNADYFELAEYGLAAINDSHLKAILDTFASKGTIAESIYDFTPKALAFLIYLKHSIDRKILYKIIEDIPAIAEISADLLESPDRLPLNQDDIPLVRAALYHQGFYKGHDAGGYHVNTSMLTSAIYPNVLKKRFGRLRVPLLSFYPGEPPYKRELSGVPIASKNDDGITKATFMAFRRSLISLATLHAIGVGAPRLEAIQIIENYKPELIAYHRFTPVPSDIIHHAFRHAVELHFKHGRMIIDGFLKLAKHCVTNRVEMTHLSNEEIIEIIGPELANLGVKKLGLACQNFSSIDGTQKKPRKSQKATYYKKLRNNEGLLELLAIYIGGVQVVIGALMARRASELMGLPTSCLDSSLEWLIIEIAKSTKGLWGERETQARPLDKLGTKMIRELQRMQRYLKKIGFLTHYDSIFSTPTLAGNVRLHSPSWATFNRNLDLFCDYVQTGTDPKGRRYYLRQHQLRRYFALMFFHYFDEGTIHTLRWVLGHRDAEHIWNYITATLDGESLRGAKSQHIAQQMVGERGKQFEDLAKLLKSEYGISNFSAKDEDVLDSHLQDLMMRGVISIEPIFFESHDGKHMKVAVKIHHS
ncbi:hypothetical protein [Pseudomonas sp. B21-047]|uniref:hypothetical protein n=1 Tax=Pseudomonas sp. B21-047 TaxID=2895489 RepID=UPI002160EF5A|nr:hypothetical protein [Pseudomonas sp. B21-047]UVL05980.1 hypothetical protein LOY26_10750 [Pseudomonas sp. B21-047]